MGIRKEMLALLLCLFLVTFVLVIFSSTLRGRTIVYVDPTEKMVYLNDSFTIDVKVADVADLYAYDIILYYRTIPLDALSVELPPKHFFEPLDNPVGLSITRKEIDDNYNATHGRVWVSTKLSRYRDMLVVVRPLGGCARCILQHVLFGKTGSGVLFTITFRCTSEGTTVLNLYQTQLISNGGSPIFHTRIHGTINVHR